MRQGGKIGLLYICLVIYVDLMTRNLQKDSDNKRGVFYIILLVKCFIYFL